jgi:hypothetical protein
VVAQLIVVQPRGDELAEHVAVTGALLAAAGDERHELLVDHRHATHERAPRAARSQVTLDERHRRGARQRGCDAERGADVGGQARVVRAEDRA